MAKKKTAVPADIRELQSTLAIDGKSYNINAKNAESADKVAHELTIKKIHLTGEEEITFNGEQPKSVNIVPAEGGIFSGSITVPSDSIEDHSDVVLNRTDIKNFIVSELGSNSVLYTWNGTTLKGGGAGEDIKSISIITGKDEHKDELATYIYQNNTVSAYIYISNDEGNLGNIYFGTCNNKTVAGVQVSAENALKVVDHTDNSNYFNYATLADMLQRLGTIEGNINTEIKPNIADLVDWQSSVTDPEKTGSVARALQANKASQADCASYATQAKKDSESKQINLNYYRSTFNTQHVNSIIISSDSPDVVNLDDYADGDIWIKYNND